LRITNATGTTLAGRTANSNATLIQTLLIHTHLTITRTFFGLAVDRVTDSGGTALAGRALLTRAAYRHAFLVYAYIAHTRAGAPGTVLGIADATRTGHALLAIHPQTLDGQTGVFETNRADRAGAPWTIMGQAATSEFHAIQAALADLAHLAARNPNAKKHSNK